ncbi:MAG: beta-galactosidase [bacterium]|nr:beta-galactosidase [bacterium]
MNEANILDPEKWGVSFSIKQCRNFEQDPEKTLAWLIEQGFRRFRLMSYWDEHEREQGVYDFTELDKQIDKIDAAGGFVTLSLGARQPRWPENHWPQWAFDIDISNRSRNLFEFIQVVVERYREKMCLLSYQLENEALLDSFGERSEIDRLRLRAEYKLIKRLDPARPIIMTTSTSWGIPLRSPIPDIVGFSLYNVVYDGNKQKYGGKEQKTSVFKLRANLIKLIWRRPSFIHELQLEPWGPKAIWEMDHAEQDKSMSLKQLDRNIRLAKKMNLYPIDFWGGEWWYERSKSEPLFIINILKLLKH